MKLFDSHCHLDTTSFGDSLPAVIARARAADVGAMISIGTGIARGREARALAEQEPDIWFAVGVHPHDALSYADFTAQQLRDLLGSPRAVALGEIGLDYHYMHSPAAVQRRVFEEQLALAKELELPVIIHQREAFDDCRAILDAQFVGGAMLIHCFTGSREHARAFLDRGCLISIPGVVTFSKAQELQDAVRYIPEDRMLLETDAPYLAPQPYRGKRNEPAYLIETARQVALLCQMPLARLVESCTRQTEAFFRVSCP